MSAYLLQIAPEKPCDYLQIMDIKKNEKSCRKEKQRTRTRNHTRKLRHPGLTFDLLSVAFFEN